MILLFMKIVWIYFYTGSDLLERRQLISEAFVNSNYKQNRINLHATRKAIASLTSIRTNAGDHLCSGALFTEMHTLTVAICVYKLITPGFEQVKVWVGIAFASNGGTSFPIADIQKDYRFPKKWSQQFAVVKVSTLPIESTWKVPCLR